MRLALVAAFLTGAALITPRGGAQDAPADARASKLKDIQKAFSEEFEGLKKKISTVKTPAERNGVISEAKELAVLTTEKLAKLAAENPKDAVAFDAARTALTTVRIVPFDSPNTGKLIDVIVAHHLGNPALEPLVMRAGQLGADGEKLLNAVAEKGTTAKMKGMALYFLGSSLAERADDAPNEKAAAELSAKAITYLEKAVKDAGDVPLGPDTIGKRAGDDLTALKTLGVGKVAPDVEGVGLKDEKTKLSSLKGKVVLLDIWATWCPPCRAMIPHEREMVKKMEGKPFVLVSVSADDKKETLTDFLKDNPMPWTHWWEGQGGSILRTYRVRAFPTLFLIDAKGVIRKKWVGSPPNDVLDKAVEDLVREAGTTN